MVCRDCRYKGLKSIQYLIPETRDCQYVKVDKDDNPISIRTVFYNCKIKGEQVRSMASACEKWALNSHRVNQIKTGWLALMDRKRKMEKALSKQIISI